MSEHVYPRDWVELYRAVLVGAGSRAWERSAIRLSRELSRCEFISEVNVYSGSSLRSTIPEFWQRHGDFVARHKKGFGYWIWKPYVLSRALEDLSPNESGVLYIDAGCSMNLRTAEARRRFQQYLEASDSSGGLFFRLNGNNSHASYTKKSVLDKLGSREMAVENLVAATTFFLARSAEARVFLERWSNLMSLDDYEHLLDPTMQELQTEDFVAHRHDQSLLSIVLREFNFAIVPDETYFSPNWRTHGRDFPIWATRIRSAFPFVSENFAMKVIRRLERAIFK